MQCLIFVFLIVLISCDWSDESYGVVSVLRLERNSHVSSSFANNYSGSFKAKMYSNNPYFFFWKWIQKEKKCGWKENKPWANSHTKLFAMLACRAIHSFVSCWNVHVLGTQFIIFSFEKLFPRDLLCLLYFTLLVGLMDIFFIFSSTIINLYHVLRPKILQQDSGHFSLKC